MTPGTRISCDSGIPEIRMTPVSVPVDYGKPDFRVTPGNRSSVCPRQPVVLWVTPEALSCRLPPEPVFLGEFVNP